LEGVSGAGAEQAAAARKMAPIPKLRAEDLTQVLSASWLWNLIPKLSVLAGAFVAA
jgi:hypothetical protein